MTKVLMWLKKNYAYVAFILGVFLVGLMFVGDPSSLRKNLRRVQERYERRMRQVRAINAAKEEKKEEARESHEERVEEINETTEEKLEELERETEEKKDELVAQDVEDLARLFEDRFGLRHRADRVKKEEDE